MRDRSTRFDPVDPPCEEPRHIVDGMTTLEQARKTVLAYVHLLIVSSAETLICRS